MLRNIAVTSDALLNWYQVYQDRVFYSINSSRELNCHRQDSNLAIRHFHGAQKVDKQCFLLESYFEMQTELEHLQADLNCINKENGDFRFKYLMLYG